MTPVVANKAFKAHPAFCPQKNAKGELTSYEYDDGREIEYWTDVIGLDYRQPVLHVAMIGVMKHWVTTAGVDRFRRDVVSLVPTRFWLRARKELDSIKPLFRLAESNDRPSTLLRDRE